MKYEILHVLPINDLSIHSEAINYFGGIPMTCLCMCEPELKVENETLIFVHNSFDGREGVEWTNEQLNPEQ